MHVHQSKCIFFVHQYLSRTESFCFKKKKLFSYEITLAPLEKPSPKVYHTHKTKCVSEGKTMIIWFDLLMMVVLFFMGLCFYRSNGKGANLLSGYNMKTKEERSRFDEPQMCRIYGRKMMQMAIPFFFFSFNSAARSTRYKISSGV